MTKLCKCGCGKPVSIDSNTYINGHNPRKIDGFKKWRENNHQAFIEHQKKAGRRGYVASQVKHPDFNKNALKRWRLENPEEAAIHQSEIGKIGGKIGGKHTVERHPDLMSSNGKKTYMLHPNMSRLNMIKRNKDNPNMAKEANKRAHELHPNSGKIMTDWLKKNKPEHFRDACIKSLEKQSERGFVSQPERIMRQLLPRDFFHNRRLGKYLPDFHSKERKIVIEVDGKYWHSLEGIKQKDELKTAYFQSLGYTVFRIPENDVNEYFKTLRGDCCV